MRVPHGCGPKSTFLPSLPIPRGPAWPPARPPRGAGGVGAAGAYKGLSEGIWAVLLQVGVGAIAWLQEEGWLQPQGWLGELVSPPLWGGLGWCWQQYGQWFGGCRGSPPS